MSDYKTIIMDIQSNSREIATPLNYKNISFYKAEDSGYHTSFATPSLECSSTPNELQDQSLLVTNICQIKVDCYSITPGSEVGSLNRHYSCGWIEPSLTSTSLDTTPLARRGLKRRYDEGQNEGNICAVATPTSLIANEVQKLKVNDAKISKPVSTNIGLQEIFVTETYSKDVFSTSVTHPSTPIKKICRTNCNLSPFNRRKSPRKVDFAIHSLSCEKQELKIQPKPQSTKLAQNRFGYKPNQKLDIIKMLYQHETYCSTSIKKILNYLSEADIFNFTLVSPTWRNIFIDVNTKRKCKDFFKTVKSDLENRNKVETPKLSTNQSRPLKEVQSVNLIPNILTSPTRSPRTTRFNKFTKAASLDPRSHILCIKCRHPAKVTIEASGEEWGECTSSTCAEQFCRLCKFERHPGKSCLQYDLNGPSPSKRKKNMCPVSSHKSKKNLKRLLHY